MTTYYTKEGKFKVHSGYISYDKLHRLDGPAIIFSSGTKKWWVNGKKHRLDGPAVTTNLGTKQWWVNGKKHRLDGPAIVWHNGDKEWWVNGKKLNTKKVKAWIKNNNINLKTKQHQALFMVMFG